MASDAKPEDGQRGATVIYKNRIKNKNPNHFLAALACLSFAVFIVIYDSSASAEPKYKTEYFLLNILNEPMPWPDGSNVILGYRATDWLREEVSRAVAFANTAIGRTVLDPNIKEITDIHPLNAQKPPIFVEYVPENQPRFFPSTRERGVVKILKNAVLRQAQGQPLGSGIYQSPLVREIDIFDINYPSRAICIASIFYFGDLPGYVHARVTRIDRAPDRALCIFSIIMSSIGLNLGIYIPA